MSSSSSGSVSNIFKLNLIVFLCSCQEVGFSELDVALWVSHSGLWLCGVFSCCVCSWLCLSSHSPMRQVRPSLVTSMNTQSHTWHKESYSHISHTHSLFLAIARALSLSFLLTCVLHQYFLLGFKSHYLKFLLSFFLSDKTSSSLSVLSMVCMFMHAVQCDSSLVHNLVASCS